MIIQSSVDIYVGTIIFTLTFSLMDLSENLDFLLFCLYRHLNVIKKERKLSLILLTLQQNRERCRKAEAPGEDVKFEPTKAQK